jgi:hypothetical protein
MTPDAGRSVASRRQTSPLTARTPDRVNLDAREMFRMALLAAFRDEQGHAEQLFVLLTSRLAGPELDLRDLNSDEVLWIYDMPPPCWDALQRLAAPGITTLALGPEFAIDEGLVHCLGRLQTLEHLTLPPETSLTENQRQLLEKGFPNLETIAHGPGRPQAAPSAEISALDVPVDAVLCMNALGTAVRADDDVGAYRAAFDLLALPPEECKPVLADLPVILERAMTEGRSGAVRGIVKAVTLPLPWLEGPRLALLHGHASTPLLTRLCEHGGTTPWDAGRIDCIHDFMQEVLKPSRLDGEEQNAICQSAGSMAMRNGHPAAAAMMIMAVLECDLPPARRADLLLRLAVTPADVKRALNEPEQWSRPLSRELAARLGRTEFAFDLLRHDGRVVLRGDDEGFSAAAGLRAEKIITSAGKVRLLCSATQPLSGLAPAADWVDPGGRPHAYAVPPGWLVEAT